MKKGHTITTEELDEKFDNGEDVRSILTGQ